MYIDAVARIEKTHGYEGHIINVQVWRNWRGCGNPAMDGWYYCGEGRFFKNMRDAILWIREHGLLVDRCVPELVPAIEEDDWDVFLPATAEHGRCIGYRQDAFHDIHTYEDGYEDRTYIGD